MDVLGSANQLELTISRTQMDEERNVRALASGLRVITASDDPSGMAIAETIHTKVSGLQQGVQNVQTAGNLLNTADSALSTVQKILTRIHTLIVQASSDLNSTAELQSIQTEIDGLLKEVNKISSQATFNGVKLFDGSLATYASAYSMSPSVQQVTAFDQGTSTQVYDANNTGKQDPGPLIYANPGTIMYDQPGFVQGLVEFQIIGYSTNPTDPNTGPLGAPGVYVKITQYSTDPAFGGTNGATEQISVSALATSTGPDQGSGMPLSITTADGSQNMLVFDLANLSAQDVGVSMAFETFNATPASSINGHALEVNSTGTEGGTVQISLPSVSTTALGINSITVMPAQEVNWQNTPTGTGNNAAATADAEARVQNAIDAISEVRAKVGAQSVSLQEDAGNASLEIVNQIASESAIRDVGIGQSAADLSKDQVLARIDVSVLSQMQVNAQLVIQLVGGTGPGTQGRI